MFADVTSAVIDACQSSLEASNWLSLDILIQFLDIFLYNP